MQRISGLFKGKSTFEKMFFPMKYVDVFWPSKIWNQLWETRQLDELQLAYQPTVKGPERTWKVYAKKTFGMESDVKNGSVGIPNNNLMEKIVSDDYCSESVTISDMILLIPKNKVSFLFTQFGLLVAQISSDARLQRKCLRFRFHSLACLGILRLRS